MRSADEVKPMMEGATWDGRCALLRCATRLLVILDLDCSTHANVAIMVYI